MRELCFCAISFRLVWGADAAEVKDIPIAAIAPPPLAQGFFQTTNLVYGPNLKTTVKGLRMLHCPMVCTLFRYLSPSSGIVLPNRDILMVGFKNDSFLGTNVAKLRLESDREGEMKPDEVIMRENVFCLRFQLGLHESEYALIAGDTKLASIVVEDPAPDIFGDWPLD